MSELLPGDIIMGHLALMVRDTGLFRAVSNHRLELVTVVRVDGHNNVMTSTGKQLRCYDPTYDCVNR